MRAKLRPDKSLCENVCVCVCVFLFPCGYACPCLSGAGYARARAVFATQGSACTKGALLALARPQIQHTNNQSARSKLFWTASNPHTAVLWSRMAPPTTRITRVCNACATCAPYVCLTRALPSCLHSPPNAAATPHMTHAIRCC